MRGVHGARADPLMGARALPVLLVKFGDVATVSLFLA